MQLVKSVTLNKVSNIDVLVIENERATSTISLFGGQILSFKPKSDGRERLFLSNNAALDGINAIRGGVPVCWPWFSDSHGKAAGELPSHGYVRKQTWDIVSSEESDRGTGIVLRPQTTVGEGLDGSSELLLDIFVADTLTVKLITRNTGKNSIAFTTALHTYFAVEDVEKSTLVGLDGLYKDKTRDWNEFETPASYRFSEETDRVHLCQAEWVQIEQPSVSPTKVGSRGHDSLVVWNPWKQNSESMADMEQDGYKKMLCLETAITQGKQLSPGEEHILIQEVC